MFYPQMVGENPDVKDLLNLIQTLDQQDDEAGLHSIFQGVDIDWNTLTADQRNAMITLGAAHKKLAPKMLRSNLMGPPEYDPSLDAEPTGGFNFGDILGDLFNNADDIINAINNIFTGGGTGGGAPLNNGNQKPTDFTPIITAVKWLVGGLVVCVILYGGFKLLSSSKSTKAA